MDHIEARELLDLAAVEPGGLDRLMAGDTPTAHALAGHLAGCAACTEEFSRVRQSAAVLRDVIATQPSKELRARTLSLVAAVGRPRGGPADVPAPGAATAASGEVPLARVVEVPAERGRQSRGRGRPSIALLAAAAALVIVTAGATGFVVSASKDNVARQASLELEGLTEVAQWTARLDAQPDVQRVLLATQPAAAGGVVGSLVFSPSTHQLVVVADGLTEPQKGHEYRCWVEIGGSRQRLGRMYQSGALAYWVGDATVLANVPAGSRFGVSLVDVAGSGGAAPTVLSGTLQST